MLQRVDCKHLVTGLYYGHGVQEPGERVSCLHLDAIYFAAGTVASEGGHSCKVASAYKDQPAQSVKSVIISCGHKGAVISFSRAKGTEVWSVTKELR
jgi:hypothetical protein